MKHQKTIFNLVVWALLFSFSFYLLKVGLPFYPEYTFFVFLGCLVYSIPKFWIEIKNLLDAIYPIRDEQHHIYKRLPLLSILAAFISLISFFTLWQNNTINSQALFLYSCPVGLFTSIITLLILPYFFKGIYATYFRRWVLGNAILFSITLLTIGSASKLNISLSDGDLLCGNFLLTQKHTQKNGRNKSIMSYSVDIIIDGSKENIRLPKEEWDTFSEAKLVEVCFIEGYFGFEKVYSIENSNSKWD